MTSLVRKIVPASLIPPLEFEWRPHEYVGENRVRVWKSTWGADQFEVMGQHEFAALKEMCRRFSILLTKASDD